MTTTVKHAIVFSDINGVLNYWDGRKFHTATDITEYYYMTALEAKQELQKAEAFTAKNEWIGNPFIDTNE